MSKKKIILVSGGALLALLLVALAGATIVFAQQPTPQPDVTTTPWRAGGRGWGGLGPGLFGLGPGGQWTMFDAAAQALGLTPEELFAGLHSGKTLEEIAQEQGVEMDAVQEALETAHKDAMRQAIEQAVEEGTMTQEQADWMLEGLDKGFLPMGRGFRRGPGGGRHCFP